MLEVIWAKKLNQFEADRVLIAQVEKAILVQEKNLLNIQKSTKMTNGLLFKSSIPSFILKNRNKLY